MSPDDVFNLFLLSIPFWIPAAIGFYLVGDRRNELSLMAGLLTLKPILTTPLWALIISSLEGSTVSDALISLLSMLPGASLTILALAIFRQQFSGSGAAPARLLILLDCMRWLNSGLCLGGANALSYNPATGALTCIFALIGLIFPTAYAVVALTTTLATQEHEMAG
jgi:hypothetical protein